MDKKTEEKEQEKKTWNAYELALNLGFMIALPVVGFGVGGVLLDKYLDSFPIFVFVGFLLAMISGLLIVIKKTKDIIITGKPKEKPKK